MLIISKLYNMVRRRLFSGISGCLKVLLFRYCAIDATSSCCVSSHGNCCCVEIVTLKKEERVITDTLFLR